jgi:hypothetical protein
MLSVAIESIMTTLAMLRIVVLIDAVQSIMTSLDMLSIIMLSVLTS